jgi:hypothetical protein
MPRTFTDAEVDIAIAEIMRIDPALWSRMTSRTLEQVIEESGAGTARNSLLVQEIYMKTSIFTADRAAPEFFEDLLRKIYLRAYAVAKAQQKTSD